MCGINGFSWNDERLIQQMNAVIKHRGPDDDGTYTNSFVSLGNVRLSIIDLSPSGHQPMTDTKKKLWIVYNGEIYNFHELRETLQKKGYVFTSHSDTETILYAYKEWGIHCSEKLKGMWAFAIYDMEKKELFLSRDRFGIKPLYYYYDGEKLIFSSEIKALFKHSCVPKEQNDEIIFDYLYFHLIDHVEDTFFKGIKRLMPAHNAVFELKQRKMNIWQYYTIPKSTQRNWGTETFKKLFFTVVQRHLTADVPVGSCLSGGLDSSSIVCAMRKILPDGEIKTFSLIFPGKKIDEDVFQNEVAKKCKVDQFKTTFDEEDILRDIRDLVYTQEEPFGSLSMYGQYRVMKLAKENNLKVLLDGQGGDEILGGYEWFYGYYLAELLFTGHWIKAVKEFFSYKKYHKNILPLKCIFLLVVPRPLIHFLWRKRYLYFNNIFLETFKKRQTKDALWNSHSFQDISILAETYFSLPELLRYDDKNSMRWGVESRVPLCDHDLVEYVISLPTETKIQGDMAKIILRDALKDILPEMIRSRRDKIGFATPDETLLRTETGKTFAFEIFRSESFKKRPYWNQGKVEQMLDKHVRMKQNHTQDLWKMIILELWFRMWIDESSVIK